MKTGSRQAVPAGAASGCYTPAVLAAISSGSNNSSLRDPLLRIVVLGNSQALVVATFERSRIEGTYGELLERRLRARGVETLVFNEARWWDLIQYLRPRLVPSLAVHTPDVVVLGYGMGECEANIPPTWMMRIMDDARWTPRLYPAARAVRKVLLRPAERLRSWTYRAIVPRLGMRTWRLRPSRFEAELKRTIEWTRRQTGGLVIVLTMHDPGDELEKLLPGFRERAELFNRIMRDVVAAYDSPEVQIVEAGPALDKVGEETATIDGIHFTPIGHEAIAELLDAAITEWMASTARRGQSPWRGVAGVEASPARRRAAGPRRSAAGSE